MNKKWELFGVVAAVLSCPIATANTLNISRITSLLPTHPIVSLAGGYASVNAGGNTQSFTGTDSNLFIYTHSDSEKNTGFVGVFLGAEHALSWVSFPGLLMQTGVEYNYFGNVSAKGTNSVGIEPETSTRYNYRYNFQTQQVLGALKLIATNYKRFHPYGEVGLGAAFNHAGEYNPTTTETGSLAVTPTFRNQNQTQFSYNLGLGVETQVRTNIRVGLGYRYSNFGASSLGNGAVAINNYQSPVPFTLSSSNTYAHQLIARISYLA